MSKVLDCVPVLLQVHGVKVALMIIERYLYSGRVPVL
jgi:hypothetical protein